MSHANIPIIALILLGCFFKFLKITVFFVTFVFYILCVISIRLFKMQLKYFSSFHKLLIFFSFLWLFFLYLPNTKNCFFFFIFFCVFFFFLGVSFLYFFSCFSFMFLQKKRKPSCIPWGGRGGGSKSDGIFS